MYTAALFSGSDYLHICMLRCMEIYARVRRAESRVWIIIQVLPLLTFVVRYSSEFRQLHNLDSTILINSPQGPYHHQSILRIKAMQHLPLLLRFSFVVPLGLALQVAHIQGTFQVVPIPISRNTRIIAKHHKTQSLIVEIL